MTDHLIRLGYDALAETSPTSTDSTVDIALHLKRANRHGLIAGATGTGKTVTLQAIAESFSQQGVPVFMADVKGDLSGISQAGKSHPKVNERLEAMGLETNTWAGCPTVFWDIYGKHGHPIRATVSDMGPLLLARLLRLNDTQEGILHIAFALADDDGLLLLDLKDLRAILQHLADNAKELRSLYGNISAASVGAIQRKLLAMQRSGAKAFFGEPMLDVHDLMRHTKDGQGYINVLSANKLIQEPSLYSTCLLWLLSELFETLPEIGDPEKPELVLFFDEAHLMFKDAPKILVEKVEQVVRLIRSKGVGVYFISQSPGDIPETVLGQLGNRVQHALRAFTPKDQKVVAAAASTFRSNKSFDVKTAIGELGVGEALVSTLLEDGSPSVVKRTMIKPPVSRIGPATATEKKAVIADSPVKGSYDDAIDRESASELLAKRAEKAAKSAEKAQPPKERINQKPKRRSNRQGIGETFLKSVARGLGSRAGRSLVRGIMGSLFSGR